MGELPTGTVTLVFTDIEGSTRLLETLGESYGEVLAKHRSLLRQAFSTHGGIEVDSQGDAFFYAFPRATDAVVATSGGQRALADHTWPEDTEIRVRMGIHTGEPTLSGEGYVGADVHRAARICSAAHGGQVLVSEVTARLLGTGMQDITLRNLGTHGLKDLREPQHLYQLVIAGLRDDFPAIRSLDSRPNNLPRQLTPVVGREQEIKTGCRLLLEEDTALLSLTGPGGTGKTRLALALGQELLDSFAHGVFFVDLSTTIDASLVISVVASTLSLRESGAKSITETLSDHLAGKQMLLILDNFEQVIEAAPEVSSLLASARDLKVLVTTREPLRLRGERELQVTPLHLPDSQHNDPEILATSPAVALFTDRARVVKASFELTADNAASVAAICRRLDGLPLALELAAARIRTMSPSSLLKRLDRSLEVLTGGQRDLADRQRTLRAAISWSYELLDDDEKRLFSRLGVFAGGFTTDAAEAVTDRGDLSVPIWEGLSSLVDKSLVRLTNQDAERFSMLETIRSFTLERLEESGEAEEIRRAHAEFFRGLAEEAWPVLASTAPTEALERLRPEEDNTRAALRWSALHKPALTLELAGYLWRLWWMRGLLTEARSWLEVGLRTNEERSHDRARALRGLSIIARVQGDHEIARVTVDEAIALDEASRDLSGLARSLETRAFLEGEEDRPDEAEAYLVKALELYTQLGDDESSAGVIINLSDVALLRGEYQRALELSKRSLKLHEDLGYDEGVAASLGNMGLAILEAGGFTEAEGFFRRALRAALKLDHAALICGVLEGLAASLSQGGDDWTAAQLLGAAEKERRRSGISRELVERRVWDRAIALVLERIGSNRVEALFAQSQNQSIEQVLERVLQDP
jgi:predicted ATPase/class 3 adenylate cyclase